MKIGKKLDHIIDTTPYTLPVQTKIGAASKKLNNKYNLIALVDQNGKVSKVLSKSDITYILSNEITLDPAKLLIDINARINFTPIYTEDNIQKLLDFIIRNKTDNVVIVDKAGQYNGIINKNKLTDAIKEMVD